jgi:hypothetical protein
MRAVMLVVAWVSFVGCNSSVAWDPALRPVAVAGSSPEFAARVDAAVVVWQQMLGCPDVFSGTSGTGPVYEVTPKQFASIDVGPTVAGETWEDKVWINNVRPEMEDEILVHELGHVLGLEHITPQDDPSSVMHPIDDGIATPDSVDVEHVGCR